MELITKTRFDPEYGRMDHDGLEGTFKVYPGVFAPTGCIGSARAVCGSGEAAPSAFRIGSARAMMRAGRRAPASTQVWVFQLLR
jgi:hypothetical protein